MHIQSGDGKTNANDECYLYSTYYHRTSSSPTPVFLLIGSIDEVELGQVDA